MSLFSNFPQGGKKAGVQSISDGGTGATTAEAALANLGGFPKADGEALKTRIQPINLGGTEASEANQARRNLGAAAVKEMTKAEYDALPAIDPTIFYALTDVEAEGVKIEVGSYVGTGTYGASNKNTLSFGFEPKLVILENATGYSGMMLNGINYARIQYLPNTYSAFVLSWSGNTLSWYCTKAYYANGTNAEANAHTDNISAAYQYNKSGETYRYIAIG